MQNLYKTINRTDVLNSLATIGHEVTLIVEGHIGSSKSSLINDLVKLLPSHKPVYFDMASIADSGDFQLPAVNHETQTSSFYPNESFGLHLNQPMIIMFDELGKASNQSILNAVLPALNERRWGSHWFHPATIVFATTNLGSENVGDIIKPHARNRITFVRMAKPSAQDYITHGMSNDLHPTVAAWVDRNPQCFESFEDVDNPDDNLYIYHPKAQRPAFVTHRSMSRASILMHNRDNIGDEALTHLLCGTIGAPAAMGLMTFAALADQLPTRQEIIANPLNAQIPDSPAAMVLLTCQALHWVDSKTLKPWLQYADRFPHNEVKALFGLQISRNDAKINWASKVPAFTEFARKYQHLFGG